MGSKINFHTNRDIFILFVLVFFLDFSFLSIISNAYLGKACLTTALILSLIIKQNFWKNIFWIVLGAFFLNVLSPFYFIVYLTVLLFVAGIVYFIKIIFVDENLNIRAENIILVLTFFIYNILLQLTYTLLSKNISFKNILYTHNTSWEIILTRLIIVIVFYNFIVKNNNK